MPFASRGQKIISTPDKEGVIFIKGHDMLEMRCHGTTCEWTEMVQKPKIWRDDFEVMYIPDYMTSCIRNGTQNSFSSFQ